MQYMNLEERINSFSSLGEILRSSLNGKSTRFSEKINLMIKNQKLDNPWFTPGNVRKALWGIATELTQENLNEWTSRYPTLLQDSDPIRVAVIMAGNIPLVGFHDFLSVLITGNQLIAKTSSKDTDLIMYLSEILCSINPEFSNKIEFSAGNLNNFDAVIATGSDNSSRYFEYYFGKYPNIIRRNRNSVAIIEGDETDSELQALGDDVFSYFGLGCRNVSKLYLPDGYDPAELFSYWVTHKEIISNLKYANNYDFNKAIYIVNKERFYDSGYLLLKEDSRISSPVSVLFYEYYESQNAVKQQTELLKDKIQCITGRHFTRFGTAQSPHLWDYADGIDTLEFLLKKNIPGIL